MEVLFEVLGELLLQLLGEALVEMGLHSASNALRRPKNPVVAALGFVILGGAVGGFSLALFPENLVPEPYRVLNLVLTPLVAGGFMTAMGAWRARKGEERLRIDRFGYGYLFALTVGLLRFWFAA